MSNTSIPSSGVHPILSSSTTSHPNLNSNSNFNSNNTFPKTHLLVTPPPSSTVLASPHTYTLHPHHFSSSSNLSSPSNPFTSSSSSSSSSSSLFTSNPPFLPSSSSISSNSIHYAAPVTPSPLGPSTTSTPAPATSTVHISKLFPHSLTPTTASEAPVSSLNSSSLPSIKENGIYTIHTHHKDLIHDLTFNFYGTQLATCSSDHHCEIFDFTPSTTLAPTISYSPPAATAPLASCSSSWTLNDRFKAHDASILRLDFAPPEYHPHVLATCSMDRSVKIWEEHAQEVKGSGKRWVEKSRFIESRASVLDLKFAPPHLGLKLATVSSDGYLRIYEALDPIQTSQWTLLDELQVSTQFTCTLSWCPSKYIIPWATTTSATTTTSPTANLTSTTALPPSAMLIVAGAFAPKLYFQTNQTWTSVDAPGVYESTITDIAWAPTMGRSYHLIAAASKDGLLRIFKLQDQTFSLITLLTEHSLDVYRVKWNLMGSMLASTSRDGSVRVWKPFLQLSKATGKTVQWKCVQWIQVSEQEKSPGETGMKENIK